ncbi:MAG: thioredoxin [Micrococcales bacterium]
MSKSVTTATFEAEVLKSEKPVLVDFWAEWCGPCRMVSPIVDQIGEEHSDKIVVVKVNVDEESDLAVKYGITGIPAFKLFHNGEVVKEMVGAKPKLALESDLADWLK